MLFREGLVLLLGEEGFEVVGQAQDPEDLLRKVGAHKPDAAIVDIRMPPTHTDEGLRAASEIGERFPDVAVLVLSQFLEPDFQPIEPLAGVWTVAMYVAVGIVPVLVRAR